MTHLTTEEAIDSKKLQATEQLNLALREISSQEPVWEHHKTLGHSSIVHTDDPEQDIVYGRYGKVTDFHYSDLVTYDGYTIVAYYQPGAGSYGYGVLGESGDVCFEITTSDLVQWILPFPSGRWLSERIDVVDDLVKAAQKLINA